MVPVGRAPCQSIVIGVKIWRGTALDIQCVITIQDMSQNDIGETRNVAAEHPDVVRRLTAEAERAREDLGGTLANVKGGGVRKPGQLGPEDARLTW